MIAMAAVGMLLERLVIRPMVGKPTFTVVLITLGLLLIIEQVVRAVWTMPGLVLEVPWGNGRSRPSARRSSSSHLRRDHGAGRG